MGAGDSPVIGVSDALAGPGTYVLEVPCPRTRTTATIHVELVDKQVRAPPATHARPHLHRTHAGTPGMLIPVRCWSGLGHGRS